MPANPDQVALLRRSVNEWHTWIKRNPDVRPYLWGANLEGLDLSDALLSYAELVNAELTGTNLSGAFLVSANFRGANLTGAIFTVASLWGATFSSSDRQTNLSRAVLTGATLSTADLSDANLSGADLSNADLSRAILVGTDLTNANLSGCRVYGVSAWDLCQDGANQENLMVTPPGEPAITVDRLEVAQFVHTILRNERIRDVLNTLTSKAVLILGRFTPERKALLDALRKELRDLGYVPLLFDFDPAARQTRMETISTLANMVRFVIADITDAKTVLQELQGIVPGRPSLPVQPILLTGQKEPGMFDFFRMYPWFLPTVYYDSPEALLPALNERVIMRPDGMARDLAQRLDQIRSNG